MSKIIEYENPSAGELRALCEAMDKVSESVEIMDSDGLLCFVNRSFQNVTGYSAEEALGHASQRQSLARRVRRTSAER
jgi:PAS domain S-box-containing protein